MVETITTCSVESFFCYNFDNGIIFVTALIYCVHHIIKAIQVYSWSSFAAVYQKIMGTGCYPILPLPRYHLLLGLSEI